MSGSSEYGGFLGKVNPLKWLLKAIKTGGVAEWEELLLDLAAIGLVAVIVYAVFLA